MLSRALAARRRSPAAAVARSTGPATGSYDGVQHVRGRCAAQRAEEQGREVAAGVEHHRRLVRGARALAGERDGGGRIGHRIGHGAHHARQARRRAVARIVRAGHRLAAPLVGGERARDVGRGAPGLAARREVTLALPAQVALHLVARVAAADLEQALRQAQGQRRVLRPVTRAHGPARSASPLASPSARPEQRPADPIRLGQSRGAAGERLPLVPPRRPQARTNSACSSVSGTTGQPRERDDCCQQRLQLARADRPRCRGWRASSRPPCALRPMPARQCRYTTCPASSASSIISIAPRPSLARRHVVVADRLAQVLDAAAGGRHERQQRLVRRQLTGLGQVHEAGHPEVEEAPQAVHRLGARLRTRVLADQESSGHDPVGRGQGTRRQEWIGGAGRLAMCP